MIGKTLAHYRVVRLLGDCEAAVDLLAETIDTECFWRPHRNDLRLDPLWDPCRDNSRFQEILRGGGPDS